MTDARAKATPAWLRKLRLLWTVLLVPLASCWISTRPNHVYGEAGAHAGSDTRVVLLTSGANAIGREVTEGIVRNLDYPISEYVLQTPTGAGHIVQAVRAVAPKLIIALGGRAAVLARDQFPEVPLLYALVVQDDEHAIVGDTVAGVSIDMAPRTEFTIYKLALPELRNVVVFYTPRGEQLVRRAGEELQGLDVALNLIPLERVSDLEKPEVVAKARGADAFWMINDPGLLSADAFTRLLTLTQSVHKPLLCSSFREFAANGAMMALTLDFDNIGSQLATAAGEILEQGAAPSTIGVRPPLGGHLVVNAAAAEALGVHLPPELQPFISEMITAP